jgi:hypothetical protein
MQDVLFIAITIAFFVLAAGFVKICDHIIGPDPMPSEATDQPAPSQQPAPTQRAAR